MEGGGSNQVYLGEPPPQDALIWENVALDMCHNENTDEPAHPSSLISLHCLSEEILDPWLSKECQMKTGQTVGMCWLIWVFAWCMSEGAFSHNGAHNILTLCWINYYATPTSNFQSIRLLDQGCWYKYLMTNSADPDQLASEPTDLDLHCLQRQCISWFSRTRVNIVLTGVPYWPQVLRLTGLGKQCRPRIDASLCL